MKSQAKIIAVYITYLHNFFAVFLFEFFTSLFKGAVGNRNIARGIGGVPTGQQIQSNKNKVLFSPRSK